MKDPYKNNSYLRDDKEQLRERMFFEENCKKIGKEAHAAPKQPHVGEKPQTNQCEEQEEIDK